MAELEVTRLAGALGAEVRGFALEAVDDRLARRLEELLWAHHVLFFPDQHPTPEVQLAFGRRFGPLEPHPHLGNRTPSLPADVFELSASAGGVADEWHTDLTFLARPALYSILHMVEAPSVGGDTLWANPTLAYESLSPPLRALCDGLTAVHDATPHGRPDERAVHPVVRVHPETGRRALYVNEHFTRRIVELSHVESELLLGHLHRWIAQPRFSVRYRWSRGAVAMWDNRATQHYVLNDFRASRVIRRVTVMGDRPEPAGVLTWPAFTRVEGPSDTSRHDAILADLPDLATTSGPETDR